MTSLNDYNKPIIFGSIVGVTEHIAILPLRTILDHQQYFSKQHSISQLMKNKLNTVSSLYKGTSICLTGVAIGHIGLFTMLEQSKKNERYSFIYGTFGKLIHDICIVPTDTIRMYSNVHSHTLSESIRQIYKTSGYKGFFKGLIPASISNLPAGAIEFTVLSYFRRFNNSDNQYYTFLSGGIAGLCSSVITSPIDTVKTYVQCSQKDIKQSIKDVYKERGLMGFFRGIPNKIISASLSFGVYEYLSNTFKLDYDH